jgi:hypothetical protein
MTELGGAPLCTCAQARNGDDKNSAGALDIQRGGDLSQATRRIRHAAGMLSGISPPLAQLRLEQWRDAFRAAGYDAPNSERFIVRIRERIAEGHALIP